MSMVQLRWTLSGQGTPPTKLWPLEVTELDLVPVGAVLNNPVHGGTQLTSLPWGLHQLGMAQRMLLA